MKLNSVLHIDHFPCFRHSPAASGNSLDRLEAWSNRNKRTWALWRSVSWSRHERRAWLAPDDQSGPDILFDSPSMFGNVRCGRADLAADPWDRQALVCPPPLFRGIWRHHRLWPTYGATICCRKSQLVKSLRPRMFINEWNLVKVAYYFIRTQNAKLDSLDISIWCRRICNTGIYKCHLWLYSVYLLETKEQRNLISRCDVFLFVCLFVDLFILIFVSSNIQNRKGY
jgi:hypothetical protein